MVKPTGARIATERGFFIYTYSGVRFYPTDPHADEMLIEDIAHALTNACRWSGHVKKHYSVAEHSSRMALLASTPQMAFSCLMHDCSETWLVDLATPVKAIPHFGARYRTLEGRIMDVAAERFGFLWPKPDEVRRLDQLLLNTEQRDLMPPEASQEGEFYPEVGTLPRTIVPWSQRKAKTEFMRLYDLLS